jgi:stage II sporulation protein D
MMIKTLSVILMAAFATVPFTSPLCAKAAAFPTDSMQKVKPATIKVLLQDDQDKFLLEVKGSYKVFCPHTNGIISSSSGAKRSVLQSQKAGLFWGDSFPGAFGVRIVPNNGQTSILVNGIQYRGCLEVYDINGKLRVINEVDMENYLRSTLATQFIDVSESEVLNALTIVARTNAYFQVYKFPEAPWHVTAAESNYQGYGATLQYLPIEQAIESTRHAILTYHSEPFAASWSENTGGKTASTSTIFKDNAPAPKGVAIPGMEAERLKSSWSFQMSKQEFASLAKLAKVSNISVFSEKESGKVYAVKLENDSTTKTMDFFTLQNIVGKSKLKSNDFTMEVLDQSIKFKGFGIGNGVGLCLHTARLMAKQGLDAKKILSQFFNDTQVEKTRTIPMSHKI